MGIEDHTSRWPAARRSRGPKTGPKHSTDRGVETRRLPVEGGLIAIGSGKGGVGKTWLAVSLAQALSHQGAHTLLLDGDLHLANVDVQLGLTPKSDLSAVLAGRIPLDQAVVPAVSPGLDVIAGRSGSVTLPSHGTAPLLKLEQEIDALKSHYDRTIIDLASGLSAPSINLAAAAHTVLVIATDDPASMANAFSFIRACHHHRHGRGDRDARKQLSSDIRVVINMAVNRAEGEKTFSTLARACRSLLGADPELAGVIRRDDHVRDAVRAQEPLIQAHPDAPAARDVRALATRLLA